MLKTHALVLAALIAGCGGGSDEHFPSVPAEQVVPKPTSFVTWVGNANGEVVIDANGETFKITSHERCVYSIAENYLIVNYCGIPGAAAGQLLFADSLVSVQGVRLVDGSCVAGFIETRTGQAIDLFRLPSGQFKAAVVTGWTPIFC